MGLKDRIFSRPADAEPVAPESLTADDAVGDQPQPAETTAVLDTTVVEAPADVTQLLPVVEAPVADRPELLADAPAAEPAPAAPVDPAALVPARPTWRQRGLLRRRLKYLREVRELGYRDLGGLVVDQHRFQRPNAGLIQGKVLAIDGVDRELRAIELALGAARLVNELALPGVAACIRCGALHGSDARFCPQCGLAFAGPRTMSGMGGAGMLVSEPAAGSGQAALFDPTRAADPAAPAAALPPDPAQTP